MISPLTCNPEFVPIFDCGFGSESPGRGHARLQSPRVRVGVVGVAFLVPLGRGALASANPRLVLEPEPDRVRHRVGERLGFSASVALGREVNELDVIQKLAVVAANHHENVESCSRAHRNELHKCTVQAA